MNELLQSSLESSDKEVFSIIQNEKERQKVGLEMIASENFTSVAVLETLGCCLHNKYSEGLPGARFYGGNQFIDQMEILCQNRALELFSLDPENWGVNVQPYSGSPANFAVYTALAKPHGRIMGVSCYPRNLDYARFRQIADSCGAYLMADMAHVSGLVAAGAAPSPFHHAHVVTTTTHKSLRGPRAAMIFFRKGICDRTGKPYELESLINQAVFPGLQGGPHNNAIAAVAVALKQAATPDFKKYGHQIVSNAKVLSEELMNMGFKLVTGGTDNHLVWLDLRPYGVSGAKAEKILEEISIACNKNTGATKNFILDSWNNSTAVPGDKSAFNPGGIRLGTPALTTRGLNEEDMKIVASFISQALQLAKEIQSESGVKFVDFCTKMKESHLSEKVECLRHKVEEFAQQFYLPALI